MPTRLLRDGILRSERVDMLSPGAELFYRRLMSVVDDYGRYEARAKLLKSDCFPLKESITADEVLGWLLECQAAGGLVELYEVGGKLYLQLAGFGQRARSSSRYPAPPDTTLSVDRAAPPIAALGEGEGEGGLGLGLVVGDAPPLLTDGDIAELLERAMPRGTPPPDQRIIEQVKAAIPVQWRGDLKEALGPFLAGKRRPPQTYGFWPVYLSGVRFPLTRHAAQHSPTMAAELDTEAEAWVRNGLLEAANTPTP